jgi:hypothetical protein
MLDGNAIDINSPGYRYQIIASLNNGQHGDAWVNALSKRKCGWNHSLTNFQKSATLFYASDSDVDVDHVLSAEVIAGYNYLKDKNMLTPDSGTNQRRKEVTRKLLHDGACTLEWEYLEFVKYDDKLHDLLQKRASGVHSMAFPSGIRKSYLAKKNAEKARKEALEDRKLDAAEDAEIAAEKGGMVEPNQNQQQMKTVKKTVKTQVVKKRNIELVQSPSQPKLGERFGKRFRQSEENAQTIEMEWPCIDGKTGGEILRPFPGTLHTCMKTGKQFITFDGETRRYHVASVQGLVVRFTQETLKQRINCDGDRPFNMVFSP